ILGRVARHVSLVKVGPHIDPPRVGSFPERGQADLNVFDFQSGWAAVYAQSHRVGQASYQLLVADAREVDELLSAPRKGVVVERRGQKSANRRGHRAGGGDVASQLLKRGRDTQICG